MAASERVKSGVALGIFLLCAFCVATVGGTATQAALTEWYPGLNKSALNPPNAVFPIAWTILFTFMGIAAWLAWKQRMVQPMAVRGALFIYFVQLIFNMGWSVAFFGIRSPLAGLIVVVPFLMLVILLAARYRPISSGAFWLTVPYVLWIAFATYLNATVFWLN